MREFRYSDNVHKYKAKQGNEDAHRSSQDLTWHLVYYYSTRKVKKFLLSSPTGGKHQDALSVYFHRRTIVTKNISALQNRYTCYDKNLLSDSARRASKVLVIPFKDEILLLAVSSLISKNPVSDWSWICSILDLSLSLEKELLSSQSFCICLSMRSVGQLQTCNARFLSTYFANDCKLAAVGCETGTGLEAFEEWESGLEEAWEGAVEHKAGCCDPGSWGLASLRAACCGNRTGDPGEERCGLSSFKCKGTVGGCTVWCGITAFAATPAAADGTPGYGCWMWQVAVAACASDIFRCCSTRVACWRGWRTGWGEALVLYATGCGDTTCPVCDNDPALPCWATCGKGDMLLFVRLNCL